MSDYDSNPFADPEAVNPFSDPSVQQASRSNRQAGLDEYNPFEEGNKTRPATGTGQPTVPPPQSTPAIMQPSNDPPPYTPSSAQKVDTSELERRQQELEKKAEELARKEQEMKNMQFQDRQNNWPPLPKWFPVGPCFYQDFSVDIPMEFQRTVKLVYYIWGFYSFTLLLNVFGSLAYFIVESGGGATFGLSLLWFVLFTPCSFVCWYRPLYKAFRSDSSFNFFVFFFIFFFQFCVCVLMCLGITDFSVGWINGLKIVGNNLGVGIVMLVVALCLSLLATFQMIMLIRPYQRLVVDNSTYHKGWINGLSTIGDNKTVGAIMIIIALFLTTLAVFMILMLVRYFSHVTRTRLAEPTNLKQIKEVKGYTDRILQQQFTTVHRIYRSTGASFAKAQQEFATGVMKNEAVQSGVANAAQSAAQGAVRGAAAQYGTSGNKY